MYKKQSVLQESEYQLASPQIQNNSQQINDNIEDELDKNLCLDDQDSYREKNSYMSIEVGEYQNDYSPPQFPYQPKPPQKFDLYNDQSSPLSPEKDANLQQLQSQFNQNSQRAEDENDFQYQKSNRKKIKRQENEQYKQQKSKKQEQTQTQGYYQNYNDQSQDMEYYFTEYYCYPLENQLEQQQELGPHFVQAQNVIEPDNQFQPQRLKQKKKEKIQHKFEEFAKQQMEIRENQNKLHQFIELNDKKYRQFLDKNIQESEILYQFNESQLCQSYYKELVEQYRYIYKLSLKNLNGKKKKEGEKKNKLLNNLYFAASYHQSFEYQNEFMGYYEQKIENFRLDDNRTFLDYSQRKNELDQKLQTKKYNKIHQIVQLTMLVDKYVIYSQNIAKNYCLKDINWMIMITQYIRNAFNQEETSKALKQIYLILNDEDDQDEVRKIEWNKVIKELQYQLEVSKNFYKSHCCGYYQAFKDVEVKQNNQNFDKVWYELRSKFNGDNQCQGGKLIFLNKANKKNKMIQGKVDRKRLKYYTLNEYLNYVLKNTSEKKILEIYVDDLFNIIGQIEEF